MEAKKHERRSISDVEAELKVAKAEQTKVCNKTRNVFDVFQKNKTSETFQAYSAQQTAEIVSKETVDRLEYELNELLSQEDSTQKRARLEPCYETVMEKHRQSLALVASQKAALDAAKAISEKAYNEYIRLNKIQTEGNKAHMEAQAQAAKILADHKEVIDAYRALFTIPYKRGDPCPGCGKTFVPDKLKCRSKCVFHMADCYYSCYAQNMTLHKGLREDCPHH